MGNVQIIKTVTFDSGDGEDELFELLNLLDESERFTRYWDVSVGQQFRRLILLDNKLALAGTVPLDNLMRAFAEVALEEGYTIGLEDGRYLVDVGMFSVAEVESIVASAVFGRPRQS